MAAFASLTSWFISFEVEERWSEGYGVINACTDKTNIVKTATLLIRR